jgi:hypothetical protein
MRPVVICHQTDVVGCWIAFVFTWEKFSRFIHISSDKKMILMYLTLAASFCFGHLCA